MAPVVQRLAILGQGLIGSSITRAASAGGIAREIVVTDAVPKVRKVVAELGLGLAKVVDTSAEAVAGADLVVACVPVGQYGALAKEIGPHLKPGAIVSDVGSVKGAVVRDMLPYLPKGVHLVPAHPLAGTEHSGPEAGLADLFENRWCIVTPLEGADAAAVETVRAFWKALGSEVETMDVAQHDRVLAITSHLPHLIAFAIFHTGLRHEEMSESEVMKFSASGFRDFTRIASSNPVMWRDIFLNNKEAVLDVLRQFNADLSNLAKAIEQGDAQKLVDDLSTSRLTRRKVIEKEHISVTAPKREHDMPSLVRPYGDD
ncbi:MAG: prephenate/arogenate dehydrogenase family protein [Xanthobacteraceae bacterium]|nr:prephenate/arogenate dehydrogenase family protein [Xanthobacteraceae bacterium]QYK44800.1 MAG: prephenate/arogenate dehydrogenase family protein [Xanthobacteraceae bacterium]